MENRENEKRKAISSPKVKIVIPIHQEEASNDSSKILEERSLVDNKKSLVEVMIMEDKKKTTQALLWIEKKEMIDLKDFSNVIICKMRGRRPKRE